MPTGFYKRIVNKITIICPICGGKDDCWKSQIKKYCSPECYWADKNKVSNAKGKKWSIQSRLKLSKAKKGKPTWNKGKRGVQSHSEKTRLKMSISKQGEKSYNWKGGKTSKYDKIRNSIEIRLWREAVFARDNYTCQECGNRKSGSLNAHHIRNFAECSELRTSIENGITFCEKCHKLFHKQYSRMNNNIKQVEEFMKGDIIL